MNKKGIKECNKELTSHEIISSHITYNKVFFHINIRNTKSEHYFHR